MLWPHRHITSPSGTHVERSSTRKYLESQELRPNWCVARGARGLPPTPAMHESAGRHMIAGLEGIDTMESGGRPQVAEGLRLDPNVVAQRIGDDVVLVHLRTNRIFELNATGGRVWALLAAGAGPD